MGIRVSLVVLIWLSAPVAAQQQTFQLPTATEVFNLRSKCAALGEKIIEDNLIAGGLVQTQVSHYDPTTNRCYVELIVQTADSNVSTRHLYDGQTKELLATAAIEKGQRWGMIYNGQLRSLTHASWEDAAAYIDKMMADDR